MKIAYLNCFYGEAVKRREFLSAFFAFLLLFSACGDVRQESFADDVAYHLDFEECLGNERTLRLSEIADTIEYLELKTPEDLIVSFIQDIISVDDFLIIESREGVDKFTKDGTYITSFGRRGQGPGEYFTVFGIDVDRENKEVIISDQKKLLFYDYDGNLLREERGESHYTIGFSDSILWAGSFDNHIYKDMLYAMNNKGDTIIRKPNPRYGKHSLNEGVWGSMPMFQKDFYRYGNHLFYNGRQTNDTIFKLSGVECEPYLIWDMGKYKLPAEYEAWYSWNDFRSHGVNYWGIPSVCESDRYFFFMCQRFWTVAENEHEHSEDNYRYMLYDKETGEGFNIVGKIEDDISFGPGLWPEWVIDGYGVSAIEWYTLSNRIEEGNYEVSPAAKAQFEKFDDGTNELLVLYKLKE